MFAIQRDGRSLAVIIVEAKNNLYLVLVESVLVMYLIDKRICRYCQVNEENFLWYSILIISTNFLFF